MGKKNRGRKFVENVVSTVKENVKATPKIKSNKPKRGRRIVGGKSTPKQNVTRDMSSKPVNAQTPKNIEYAYNPATNTGLNDLMHGGYNAETGGIFNYSPKTSASLSGSMDNFERTSYNERIAEVKASTKNVGKDNNASFSDLVHGGYNSETNSFFNYDTNKSSSFLGNMDENQVKAFNNSASDVHGHVLSRNTSSPKENPYKDTQKGERVYWGDIKGTKPRTKGVNIPKDAGVPEELGFDDIYIDGDGNKIKQTLPPKKQVDTPVKETPVTKESPTPKSEPVKESTTNPTQTTTTDRINNTRKNVNTETLATMNYDTPSPSISSLFADVSDKQIAIGLGVGAGAVVLANHKDSRR